MDRHDAASTLDTTLSRLLFAPPVRRPNLLISDQVTADSQLLFRRSLDDRRRTIAPFLHFDKDPYLVIPNGKLYYIQDAYTISDRFPNAQDFDGSTCRPAAAWPATPSTTSATA